MSRSTSRCNASKEARRRLFDAFGGRCAYCLTADADHLDHVAPWSAGGGNGVMNMVPACTPCGESKGGLSIVDWVRALVAGQTEAPNPNRLPDYAEFRETSPRLRAAAGLPALVGACDASSAGELDQPADMAAMA